jgi:hypothetical protein
MASRAAVAEYDRLGDQELVDRRLLNRHPLVQQPEAFNGPPPTP